MKLMKLKTINQYRLINEPKATSLKTSTKPTGI